MSHAIIRWAAIPLALFTVTCLPWLPARAQTAPAATAPGHGLQPISDAELADLHGGFDWNGMTITFGADIRTYLNGELALQTLVNLTPSGLASQTTAGAGLTQATAAQLQASVGGMALASLASGAPVYFSSDGQTAIVQASNGALQNVLINTSNGLQATQQTNATIGLTNYSAFANAIRTGALANTLGQNIASFIH